MTQKDRVFHYIKKTSEKPECDDCIKKVLSFSQRQTVNIHARSLEAEGFVRREKMMCARCGGDKLCSATADNSGLEKNRSNEPSVNSGSIIESKLGLSSLRKIGFKKVGLWAMDEGRLSLQLFSMRDARPALYAFICNQEVLYIGKTSRKLYSRLYLYSKPGPTQSTNIRLNDLIVSAIRHELVIEIYAFASAENQNIGEFNLDIPAALEDDIILKVSPVWNKRKSK